MIERSTLSEAVTSALAANPVVALLGPRQCGKTALARMIASTREDCEFFDLGNPVDIARLTAPMQALAPLRGRVIIDEIQRRPELFELLRVLVDRPDSKAVFLVLGSASPRLVKGASESLAGRVGFVDMSGFTFAEQSRAAVRYRDQVCRRAGAETHFTTRDSGSFRTRQFLNWGSQSRTPGTLLK